MSQTSFSSNMSAYGYEGQLADSGENDVVTGLAEVAIPFGKLAVRGTDKANQVILPTTAGEITDVKSVMGIALHDQAREQTSSTSQYALKAAVSCLRKGRVVVKVQELVVAGNQVTIRHAAGGLGIGSFGTTDDADHAILPGAVYMSGAAANGFAVVELNLI